MADLSRYLEPAETVTEFATLADALPTLSSGRPVWLRRPERWAGLLSQQAVGHSRLRRIVDLPLVEVPPIDLHTDPSTAIDCAHAEGYVPVTEAGDLIGQVHLPKIRSEVPLMRADIALRIAHDMSNALQAFALLAQDEAELQAPFAHTARLLARLKMAAGQTGGPPGPVDIAVVVREEVTWLSKVVAPAILTVQVEGTDHLGVADRASIERILMNLITNARDASGETGEIEVGVRPTKRWIVVDVKDRGPGIPENLRERVFELGSSDKGRGRGIGMASAHGSALRMGGRLELVETGPRGTHFRLWVRRVRP